MHPEHAPEEPPADRPPEEASAPPPPAEPARRRRRVSRWKVAGAAVVVAVIVVVAMLPALLSTAPGGRIVMSILSDSLGAPATAEAVSLSWGGPQRLDGLRMAPAAGFPPEQHLAQARAAEADIGLLPLLLTRRPLPVELRDGLVQIHRSADGRTSMDHVLLELERDPPDPDTPRRPLRLRVFNGAIEARDAILGVASRVDGLDGEVDFDADRLRVVTSALVVRPDAPDAPPGRLEIRIDAAGMHPDQPPEAMTVDAHVLADALDLRPYAAVLERLWQVRPPDAPVQLDLRGVTEGGVLQLHASADLHFARVAGAELRLPLAGGVAAAAAAGDARSVGSGGVTGADGADGEAGLMLRLPLAVDLERAAAAVGAALGLPEGLAVAGALEGTIEARGPASVEALRLAGADALQDLLLALEIEGRALRLAPPSQGSPSVVVADDAATLTARLRTGAGLSEVAIEALELQGQSGRVQFAGSVWPEPAAAGRNPDASPLRLDLRGAVALSLPAALAWWVEPPFALPSADPQAVIELAGLSVRGTVDAERPLTRTLDVAGDLRQLGGLRYRWLAIDGLAAGLRIADGRAAVSDLGAGVNGGRVALERLALGLDEDGAGDGYAGAIADLELAGLRIEAVQASYELAPLVALVAPFASLTRGDAALSGLIEGELDLRAGGLDLATLRRTAEGGGSLRIRDGRLGASRLLQDLAGLGRGRLAIPGLPDLSEQVVTARGRQRLEQLLFAELGSRFVLRPGTVRAEDVWLIPADGDPFGRLSLTGLTDTVDGGLDHQVTIEGLTEHFGGRDFRRIAERASRALGTDGLPLRLQGTLEAPLLRIDPELRGLPGLDGLIEEQLERLPVPFPPLPTPNREERQGEQQNGWQRILDDLLRPRR